MRRAPDGFRPRRFHAFCVGLGRAGTTSIAAIFENYRSGKFDYAAQMGLIHELKNGRRPERAADAFLRRHDSTRWLEMNAGTANHWLLPSMLRVFPDAKYIFTVRDCYSYCDSLINLVSRDRFAYWLAPIIHLEKKAAFSFPWELFNDDATLLKNFDTVLEKAVWVWSQNEEILSLLPPQRTLIVRTHEISASLQRMAEFLGVPVETLLAENSHTNANDQKRDIFGKVDRGLLRRAFERAGSSPVMRKFFPDWTLEGFLDRPSRAPRPPSSPQDPPSPAAPPPDAPIGWWLSRAERLVARRPLAFEALDRARSLRPLPDELHRIAGILLKVGRPEEALRIFLDHPVGPAGSGPPGSGPDGGAVAWIDQAEAAIWGGRKPLARRSLRKAEACQGVGPGAARRIADLYLKLGEPGRAEGMLAGA